MAEGPVLSPSTFLYDQPLPSGWTVELAANGCVFFLNEETGEQQWGDPRVPLPEPWMEQKTPDGESVFVNKETSEVVMEDLRRGSSHLATALLANSPLPANLAGWEPATDGRGFIFWQNLSTSSSSWTDPRVPLPEHWHEKKTESGVSYFVSKLHDSLGDFDPRMSGGGRGGRAPSRNEPSTSPGRKAVPAVPLQQGSWKDSYTVVRVLAKGGYGTVHVATNNSTGEEVVVKVQSFGSTDIEGRRSALGEYKSHSTLRHPHIVACLEAFETKTTVSLVLEYCTEDTLHHYLRGRTEYLPERQIMIWFAQLASAVGYLHSRGYVHRDIKLSNVFLASDMTVRLGDFGMACKASKLSVKKKGIFEGTLEILAPEILNEQLPDGKIDIWSLGVVLYALCCLRMPFQGSPAEYTAFKTLITTGTYQPLPEIYSIELAELVSDLLRKKPRFRPTIDDVLASSFVASFMM